MKISFNWLKQYLQFDLSAFETGKYLTDCGLEVEGIEDFESVKGGLQGLVIGEVLTCEKLPDSDHLKITTVNIGADEPLQIVCGAPNVEAGQKVVVAPVGTTLYGSGEPFVIKKSKIRGTLSEGMICAEDEIGIGNSHEGIMVLENHLVPGTLASDYFKIEKDHIIEIGLTPNRNDAISHFGVARDLHAVFNIHHVPCSALMLPQSPEIIPDDTKNPIDITIENKTDCPRYTGLCFENITVKESPEWLKNRLRSIGIRPINNIVDITQYVMFEMGQPLHAFDADHIAGNRVIIKNLPEGTPFVTLDGNEVKLNSEDLIICNAEEGMCIAGVYGGLKSGVTEKTTRLFLESAYFNPKTIRKTSKRHNLKTDSSFRYERGCDPDITVVAIRRAANLIQELAGGSIISGIIDIYPHKIEPVKVSISFREIEKIIGKSIDKSIITQILVLLGMEVDHMGDEQLMVSIPPMRADVTRPVDLIEEILRIYGYNNIEISREIRYPMINRKRIPKERWKKIFSSYLASNGFYEIMNNSLTKGSYAATSDFIDEKEAVHILNALSNELNVMRQTMLFSGLENIIYNINNKNPNLKLFEFGNIYKKNLDTDSADVSVRFIESPHLSLFITGKNGEDMWNRQATELDFFYLKNMITNLLLKVQYPVDEIKYTPSDFPAFIEGLTLEHHNHPIILIGQVHPAILKKFDIKNPVYYADIELESIYPYCLLRPVEFRSIPVFPAVKRDLALVVDEKVTYGELENIAYKYGSKLLKNVSLFDVYQGEKIEKGKKSYALNFVLQHPDKTLTDEEITKVMNKLTRGFGTEAGAQLR